MSDDYLEQKINRMTKRLERASKLINQLDRAKLDLQDIMSEVSTDIQADKLKLQAMRMSGEKHD